jgi:cellulose synthase/poly-beta-1,6-N-acetylglucosamine synthase-like glycosyltransferase
MTSLFFDMARIGLSWLLLVYTVVAISHYLLQLTFAHRTYRKQRSAAFADAHPGLDVPVDIVVPVYNEDPVLLEACIASALAQDHRGPVQVVVVDDGSPNRAALDAIYDRFEDLGVRIVRSPQNVGKRQAQALALPLCTGEIVVTLDSDSVLAPDAVRMLTRQFDDPKVGAATGFVDVANRTANVLTRIQRIRYWMAFNQERAAQTWFRTVMCCSGPLAAYRRTILESVRGAYLSQSYGGVACTYGDDRHLTNLVLGQGHDVVYDSGAIALTNVPTKLSGFLRQQLRWNKSFYRELIWTLPYLGSRPLFTRFDVACQVAMPVMLTVTAGSALFIGLLTNPAYILRYLALIAAAALVRSTYAAVRERDLRFYLFVVYGYISAFLLMSVRFRALSTLTDARWGTRGPATVSRASAAMANLVASIQPMRTSTQGASWPQPKLPRDWAGGAARLDGLWRAGLRSRMMAHPMEAPAAPPVPVIVMGGPALGPSRPAPTRRIPALLRRARPEPGPTPSSAAAGSVPGGANGSAAHGLHPLGTYAPGPTCRHAVAVGSEAPFCRACGAPRGLVFTPRPGPVAHLRERLASRAIARDARDLRMAARLAEEAAAESVAVATVVPKRRARRTAPAAAAPATAPGRRRTSSAVAPKADPKPRTSRRAAAKTGKAAAVPAKATTLARPIAAPAKAKALATAKVPLKAATAAKPATAPAVAKAAARATMPARAAMPTKTTMPAEAKPPAKAKAKVPAKPTLPAKTPRPVSATPQATTAQPKVGKAASTQASKAPARPGRTASATSTPAAGTRATPPAATRRTTPKARARASDRVAAAAE